MRHRKLSRRFSRTSSHRIAMMRNLSISLIEHEVIKTTIEKGKELRRFFEPLVTRAKEDNLHNRRLVISELNSRDAASKLFSDLGPRFKNTNGGYLRLIKAGFREGDKADICFVELTCRKENAEVQVQTDKLDTETEKNVSVSAEPETKKAEAKEPETKKAEAKEPETKKAEAKEPETKKAEAKEPETKKAEAKEPSKKKEKQKESWWSRFFK